MVSCIIIIIILQWTKLNKIKLYLKKFVQYKNGEILLPAIFTQIDVMIPDELADKLKEVLTQCHGQVEPIEEQCQKAFQFGKCLYMADSEVNSQML